MTHALARFMLDQFRNPDLARAYCLRRAWHWEQVGAVAHAWRLRQAAIVLANLGKP
jgi:hypothetical protein